MSTQDKDDFFDTTDGKDGLSGLKFITHVKTENVGVNILELTGKCPGGGNACIIVKCPVFVQQEIVSKIESPFVVMDTESRCKQPSVAGGDQNIQCLIRNGRFIIYQACPKIDDLIELIFGSETIGPGDFPVFFAQKADILNPIIRNLILFQVLKRAKSHIAGVNYSVGNF